ncbi:MAG: peptidoglycan-binding domain-containing protein [Acidobacteriota bacterium]
MKQGECFESIAFKYGFNWETLWAHPQNQRLREKSKTPNIVMPGDEIYIPEKRAKSEAGATEQSHRFKLKGVPSKVQLRMVDSAGKIRAGLSYVMEIQDGPTYRGKIPADGWIRHSIPPNAKTARLEVTDNVVTEEYVLQLGGLDPIYEVTGIQQRLKNLGYDLDDAPGAFGPATEAAICSFQTAHGLTETGEADKRTLDKLLEVYGC